MKTSLSKLDFKKIKKYGASHNQTFSPPCLLLVEIEWDHEILANFTPPQVPGVIYISSQMHTSGLQMVEEIESRGKSEERVKGDILGEVM